VWLLKVTCTKWEAYEVQFTVVEGPRLGRLTLTGSSGVVDAFTQGDVDDERLSYQHTQPAQLADSFRFDVRCGTERHRDLEFGLDILPATIPLEVTENLTVPHGGIATLTSNLFRVTRQQLEVRKSCSFARYYVALLTSYHRRYSL